MNRSLMKVSKYLGDGWLAICQSPFLRPNFPPTSWLCPNRISSDSGWKRKEGIINTYPVETTEIDIKLNQAAAEAPSNPLWRMVRVENEWTYMEITFFGPRSISFGPGHFSWTLLQFRVAISKRIVVRSMKSVQVQKKWNEVQKKCFP